MIALPDAMEVFKSEPEILGYVNGVFQTGFLSLGFLGLGKGGWRGVGEGLGLGWGGVGEGLGRGWLFCGFCKVKNPV